MNPMPDMVAEIRAELCPECAGLAADPCAACSHGRWGPYVRCEPDLPPLATMAVNFAKAAAGEAVAVASGADPVSDEEAVHRKAICAGCEWFRISDRRCARCGCFVENKTRFRSQRCPVGRW